MPHILDFTEIQDDKLVIKEILTGNRELFEVLIRRYNPVLYKIARGFGFNHQDAQDLMQDTHIAAYTQLNKFQSRSAYKTWISRIIMNKCLYKLQNGYFKNETPSEEKELSWQPIYWGSNENQTEKILVNRELAMVLRKCVEVIPSIYRIVFVLRAIEGLSIAETAAQLNITVMNVKIRLNRAKALLRKEIEHFYTRTDLYSFNQVYCDAMVNRVFEFIEYKTPEELATLTAR
jgi:RNA polymerase sigma-70 factor (ECF subfamily)